MSTCAYEVVDVFTDRPFAGNPLAVVYGAEALAGDQMLALAREFNLSETVFILPVSGAGAGATYRARIFTPGTELPFAGHPSIGAAVCFVRRAGRAPVTVVQECGAGLLPIDVAADGRARLTGGTPSVGDELDPGPLLEVVGLTADDFVGPAPRMAGCGLDFPYLSVTADAVGRAAADRAAAARLGIPQVSVFHWNAVDRTAPTRVFAPGVAVSEDPATGSAALGFGVWLVASGLLPGDAESAYLVRQGVELHRPSVLDCTVAAVDGAARTVTVAGGVVPIAHGEISVPPFVG